MPQNAFFPIIAITGSVHEGKTTAARACAAALRAKNYTCVGILERARFAHFERIGYDFENLHTEETRPLARRISPLRSLPLNASHTRLRQYQFDDSAWNWAENSIAQSPKQSICFLDEFGKLEAMGLGLAPLARNIARQRQFQALILVIRRDSIAPWLADFPNTPLLDIGIAQNGSSPLSEQLLEILNPISVHRDSSAH